MVPPDIPDKERVRKKRESAGNDHSRQGLASAPRRPRITNTRLNAEIDSLPPAELKRRMEELFGGEANANEGRPAKSRRKSSPKPALTRRTTSKLNAVRTPQASRSIYKSATSTPKPNRDRTVSLPLRSRATEADNPLPVMFPGLSNKTSRKASPEAMDVGEDEADDEPLGPQLAAILSGPSKKTKRRTRPATPATNDDEELEEDIEGQLEFGYNLYQGRGELDRDPEQLMGALRRATADENAETPRACVPDYGADKKKYARSEGVRVLEPALTIDLPDYLCGNTTVPGASTERLLVAASTPPRLLREANFTRGQAIADWQPPVVPSYRPSNLRQA